MWSTLTHPHFLRGTHVPRTHTHSCLKLWPRPYKALLLSCIKAHQGRWEHGKDGGEHGKEDGEHGKKDEERCSRETHEVTTQGAQLGRNPKGRFPPPYFAGPWREKMHAWAFLGPDSHKLTGHSVMGGGFLEPSLSVCRYPHSALPPKPCAKTIPPLFRHLAGPEPPNTPSTGYPAAVPGPEQKQEERGMSWGPKTSSKGKEFRIWRC